MDIWTSREKSFWRRLNTPAKIQHYLDELPYHPEDDCWSPRQVIQRQQGHCLEGALLAACALEHLGHKPLLLDLVAHRDDDHVVTLFQVKGLWGALSKSNTTLLRYRDPVYRSVRELAMSYYPFYFNVKGQMSLVSFAKIPLARFEKWHWRTSEENLIEMGRSFNDLPHQHIIKPKEIEKYPLARKKLQQACFLEADPRGLYQA